MSCGPVGDVNASDRSCMIVNAADSHFPFSLVAYTTDVSMSAIVNAVDANVPMRAIVNAVGAGG